MPSVFDKILGGLKGGGGSVLGVDISSSSIKLVQIKKKKGQAVLETYGELALGPYSGGERGQATDLGAEKMIAALKDLLRESKVTTKSCGVAIPMTSSLINIVEMPNVDSKQLARMIPLEMRKYIPVPISEVSLDWRVVPKRGNLDTKSGEKLAKGKREVFVVAVHKETISNYQSIIQQSGLNPSFFEVEIFSTLRSSVENSTTPKMVIDFGAGTTKVYVIDNGIIRDSHIINRGSQNITISLSTAMGISLSEAEEIKRKLGLTEKEVGSEHKKITTTIVEGIFSEANRALLKYQRKFNKSIDQVILTGGGSILKGLLDVAQKNIDSEVKISNSFSKLQTPAFLEKTLQLAGPEFAVAIGVALRKLDEDY
jgi:type IV pilus assembly protein PilM